MTTTLSYDELQTLLRDIFLASGCSAKVAGILSENCASAQRDGSKSHGVFRMRGYVSSLASGWVDGKAKPVVERVGPAFLRVDAKNGFAQVALADARDEFKQAAREAGIAILAIRNSHHLAALYPDIEPFAEDGFVALSVVNSMAVVAPHGAKKPVYGTNPIAFAAPRASAPPVLFDLATSTMAHGDLKVAAREGRSVPLGVGIDADGNPTTDPEAILSGGSLLTFGAHKGSAIAMMVELLCAALTGGKFSYEVDWSQHPGAQTPCTGQTIILIDPARGADGIAPFAARADMLLDLVKEAGDPRLPGDKRLLQRERAKTEGIAIAQDDLDFLLSASKTG
ncbi:Ldh family oxidoreductase [Aliihoeflea sp. PC F10.4]